MSEGSRIYTDYTNLVKLCSWMIDRIVKNKEEIVDENGPDWDWIAGEVWDFYPGVVNEFMINEAIDLILEAADQCSE